MAAAKPATAQSRSPKPQPKPQPKAATKPVAAQSRSPKPALEPQTRRQTGKQVGRQGLGKGLGKGAGPRGRAKRQGQGAAPRRGSHFRGNKSYLPPVVLAEPKKRGDGRRYSPRSESNRSEAREPRRRLDGGPSSSSHFLKIASPAVVCGCYAVAAPAAMTADTRPVPGLGTQATRSPASGRATAIRWP